MIPAPKFVFATCQRGVERVLKDEIARTHPDWKPSFSRPGFVTFKLPDDWKASTALDLRSVFARASGFCLGKTTADTAQQRAEEAWQLAAEYGMLERIGAIHVWSRRQRPENEVIPAGDAPESELLVTNRRVTERKVTEQQASDVPEADPLVLDAETHLRAASPIEKLSARKPGSEPGQCTAQADQTVLDCVLVESGQWWIGWHKASSVVSRWPGGRFAIREPEDMVSRAYLKMEEALRWSRLPVRKGDVCAELGAAPGGASQALLGRGLTVCGIDPADMAPLVLEQPNFHHWNMRGAEVQRRFFRPVQWLMADMSVAPAYTLECVESIVTHPTVNIRGMLLTLKLSDWQLAKDIPAWLEQVRSWGFRDVRARQLVHNGQEICVSALRRAALRRLRSGRKSRRKK